MPGLRRYSEKPSLLARPIIRVLPDQVWVYSSRQPRSSQWRAQAVRARVPQPPDQQALSIMSSPRATGVSGPGASSGPCSRHWKSSVIK